MSNEAMIALLEREGVTPVCAEIEVWARDGRFRDLGGLAAALEERAPAGADRARFEEVCDHLEDTVALAPGDEAIDAALAMAFAERTRSVVAPREPSMRIRALASRLAFAHPPGALLSALDRAGGEAPARHELFACWFQEVILRGASFLKDPRAIRFQEKLATARHPLAALPLELLETEREVPSYMPLYGDRGLSRALDALASGSISVHSMPPPAEGAAIKARRVEDAEVLERMTRAVRPWVDGKCGKLEARLFAVEPALRPGTLGSWLLRALPLESTATAQLECSQTPPHGVFGPLFSAASNGGASSAGLGGAYGRLAAWTSLGALAGAAGDAAVEAIDAATRGCTFLTFRAPGPWFHDVAWDLGVVALRPQGTTVAVLAATDNE